MAGYDIAIQGHICWPTHIGSHLGQLPLALVARDTKLLTLLPTDLQCVLPPCQWGMQDPDCSPDPQRAVAIHSLSYLQAVMPLECFYSYA